jgi:hypothetical protein
MGIERVTGRGVLSMTIVYCLLLLYSLCRAAPRSESDTS